METNLAGKKDGISERFAPDEDAGRLIEAEHVARYRWAAQAAPGRTAFDAGCGTAYGTELLAAAGAREVVGLDIAEAVLASVRPGMPENVTLTAGDLRELPYSDDRFELVVCFEVIEHFEDPFPVLDELVRVMSPDGLLAISSPNRGVYQSGNPHHFHEFRPDELEHELGSRLANVRLFRQHDYIVSAVLSDGDYLSAPDKPLDDLKVHKLVSGDPDGETYTVAIASNSALPEMQSLTAMSGTLELRDWLALFEHQSNVLKDRDDHIRNLTEDAAESNRVSELLIDAERRLAVVPELEARVAELERELEESRGAAEGARSQLAHVLNSPSWRVTQPLRTAKQSVARLREASGRPGAHGRG